jgi:pimeloyl-ACP methyl ester carboxylesterase
MEHGRQIARFDFDAVVPAPPAKMAPRGTVFLLHGYALDQETMLPWALWLGERGWTSVLVDLRGHGQSTGRQVGFGPLEAKDLDRILAHLDSAGRLPRPLVAMGNSYGASVALRWTANQPALDSAIAVAPYAALLPAIDRLRGDYVPWMPRWLVMAGARQLPRVLGQPATELDTTTPLSRRAIPALFVAGGADAIAPATEIGRLRELAMADSEVLVVPGANHESLPFRFPELADAVARWLERRGGNR